MWELICHHTYKANGLPIDLSPYDNNGQASPAAKTFWLADGVTIGSGALAFRESNRVYVPTQPVWTKLGGLRIEVTARLAGFDGPLQRTLIRAFDSFAFLIDQGQLHGQVNDAMIMSFTDTIEPPEDRFSVPFGQWMTVGFLHDGIDTMELSANGKTIARKTKVNTVVPPVGPDGILIGADSTGWLSKLSLDIDEIKVWRINPQDVSRNFVDRFHDIATLDCWNEFIRSLRESLQKRPECAAELERRLGVALATLRRQVAAHGPEARARYIKMSEEYLQLWKTDQISGPAMMHLVKAWSTWMHELGIWPPNDPELLGFFQSECMKNVVSECKSLDCDSPVGTLIKMILAANPVV
jgi:hypothetical protein